MIEDSMLQFKRSFRCFSCNKECPDSHVRFLEQYGKDHMFHMTCVSCGASAYISENVAYSGIIRIGVMTDIVSEELDRFMQKEPVDENSVLDIYDLLKSKSMLRDIRIFE